MKLGIWTKRRILLLLTFIMGFVYGITGIWVFLILAVLFIALSLKLLNYE